MNRILSCALSSLLIDRANGHRRRVMAAFRDRCVADSREQAERESETNRRLAALLEHARGAVPHFRDCMTGMARADAGNARQLLQRLGIMSRSEIQKAPERYLAQGTPSAADDATGGSSGTPMRFKVDVETQIRRESSLMWADSLAGWQPGERIAMLWGSDRDVGGALMKWRSRLRNYVDNRAWFNAFDMGPDRMEKFHAELERFDPHLLVAYAGSVHVYARYLADRGIRPSYPKKAIVSSAEMLTPEMRAQIEAVFSARVFDRYGNREFGAIAAECNAHEGLHVNDPDCILEIDSPKPTEIPGRLLVTYLANRAMPFIRYDTGDLAVWMDAKATCTCGRRTRRIGRIAGRESDTIRTSDGRLIHGEYFTHLLYGCRGVSEFRFIQEASDRYLLQVSGDESSVLEQAPAWRQEILHEVGAAAEVEVSYVEKIAPLASGKRKFTLSRVENR